MKSELPSNIVYVLSCTERLENIKDYTTVIVFKKNGYQYREKKNYMRPKGVMSAEIPQMRGQKDSLSREHKLKRKE